MHVYWITSIEFAVRFTCYPQTRNCSFVNNRLSSLNSQKQVPEGTLRIFSKHSIRYSEKICTGRWTKPRSVSPQLPLLAHPLCATSKCRYHYTATKYHTMRTQYRWHLGKRSYPERAFSRSGWFGLYYYIVVIFVPRQFHLSITDFDV